MTPLGFRTLGFRTLDFRTNDPQTGNDPQIGPQMIPDVDRK